MVDRVATPVIIGVGDIKNRSTKVEDAIEPIDLMHQAVASAIKDTTLGTQSAAQLQSAIDSINVVANWTWPYPDAPGLLGSRLGVSPSHKLESDHGGNSPGKLLDGAARRVAYRKSKVAVVTGGEALASLAALKAANQFPPPKWTHLDDTTSVLERRRPIDMGIVHYIALATQVYPLYETGFRAHRKQTLPENHQESMQLYGNFARVAEKHPQSWNYGKPAETEQSIGTVTKRNRMICHPYPLLMNAFNTVNLAAACIVTTTEFARELGIPESRWIYPLGGAGTSDSAHFWERENYYSSPAISKSLDKGLQVSGLRSDEIDLFDFYSCFPIVPKLACHHLNLPITDESRPVTLLGGLTSFGGAGNNYSMHAITQMVRELRNGKGRHGLVLANGGLLTYQHVVCLSATPRAGNSPYPSKDPLPPLLKDTPCPTIAVAAEGKAVIETYTVQFARDNSPQEAFVIGRLEATGHRFLANAADERTLRQLSSETVEQIGKVGWVRNDADTGRNLFTFGDSAKV